MECSVGSTIEKIKLEEQDNETKLKLKREYEATYFSINRAIREMVSTTEKYIQENSVLIKKINKVKSDLFIEKNRRDALLMSIDICKEELNKLRIKSDVGIYSVWNLRTKLCTTVQNVVDDFDIRALLVKPAHSDIANLAAKKRCDGNTVLTNEGRLKFAIERREKAVAELDRLLFEPENGAEFIRINNALRYSMEMRVNLLE